MRDRAKELKAQASGSDGGAAILAKIDEMPDDDKALATSFHQLVQDIAPDLVPPHLVRHAAYATPARDGKVVFFFRSAAK